MPKGGLRLGSGRKHGSLDTKPREPRILIMKDVMEKHKARCLESGIDLDIAGMNPVEIMMRAAALFAMEGDWNRAAQMASLAAPYMVPKLSSVDVNAKVENREPDEMSLDELTAYIKAARNDNSLEGAEAANRLVS